MSGIGTIDWRLVWELCGFVEPGEGFAQPRGAGGAVEGRIAEAPRLELVEAWGEVGSALAEVGGPGGDEAVEAAEGASVAIAEALLLEEDLPQAVEEVGGGEGGRHGAMIAAGSQPG
jgi:hypothetical protein